jgi:hypothetical protein
MIAAVYRPPFDRLELGRQLGVAGGVDLVRVGLAEEPGELRHMTTGAEGVASVLLQVAAHRRGR